MKTARNDQIDEFWRRPNFRVPGVTSRWNRPRSQKLSAIAHENGQKWPNRRVLMMSQFSCNRGHEPLKSSQSPKKLCAIAHENGQKWPNRRVLMTSQCSCTLGHEPVKSSPEPKTVCYSPRKRPEMTKSTSFDDVPIFVYQGSRAVEIVFGAKKIVCYSPWKRPEMNKSTSFDDFPMFMYPRSRVVQIVSRAKNCVL